MNLLALQLGVSNVDDLKYVLGTADDSPSSKTVDEEHQKQANNRKSQSENQFYRDSSTFLKVHFR